MSYASGFDPSSDFFINFQIGLGLTAFIGHIFPLFAGFRGGKGVATLLGVAICIFPLASSLALLIFLIILFTTRYVSLSSMCAGISFPIILAVVFHNDNQTLTVFSLFVAIILVMTHRKNISRLLNKQESRIRLYNKADN